MYRPLLIVLLLSEEIKEKTLETLSKIEIASRVEIRIQADLEMETKDSMLLKDDMIFTELITP